ncbi:MAG: hypothetical protein NT023_02040 [Armatimonadetes bacterium]|nr:hypothetical protein [Armatimonadota bacterium]
MKHCLVSTTPIRLIRRTILSCLAVGLFAASLSTSQAQLGIAHSWGYDFRGQCCAWHGAGGTLQRQPFPHLCSVGRWNDYR